MSPRAILVLILAMSGSFVTILAVVGFLAARSQPATRRFGAHPRDDVVTVTPPPATPRARPAPASATGPVGSVRDVPTAPVPLPATAGPQAPGKDVPADPELARMARLADNRLQGVEAALARQVLALKKNRDELVRDFSRHLAAMTADEAAAALKPLDDEIAILALRRLAPAPRRAILQALPGPRRAALEKRLRAGGGG